VAARRRFSAPGRPYVFSFVHVSSPFFPFAQIIIKAIDALRPQPADRVHPPHRLTSQRNDCAQPVIAQVKPKPDQHSDIDREEGVGEQWTADAHVRSDCATKIACQQDSAKNGGLKKANYWSRSFFSHVMHRAAFLSIMEPL
jgi:hypothetical protein